MCAAGDIMGEKNEITSLLAEIKSGYDGAFARLSSDFAPLLHSCIEKFGFSHSFADEALAEAQMALFRAAIAYDPARSPKTFGSYAKVCIQNALIDFRRMMDKDNALCSYEDLIEKGVLVDVADPSEVDTLSRLISEESFVELRRKIAACLSEYELEIFNYYVSDYSAADIAKQVGKSEKSVQNAIHRSVQKVRRMLIS